MVSLRALMAALNERAVVRHAGRKHDDFLLNYRVANRRPRTFAEYVLILGAYYVAHFAACIAHGGRMSLERAQEEAKQIIQRQYERRDQDIVAAFNDAVDGTNGGLLSQLQMLKDALKHQDMELYVSHILDTYVPVGGAGDQAAYLERVELARQFCATFGDQLSDSIDAEHPERYASREQFKVLVRSYVEALDRAGSQARRM